MDYANHFIGLHICLNGKVYYDAPFEKMPNLDTKGEELILVLDPSSKQTGIALGTDSGRLLMSADFIRKGTSFAEYKTYLNDYLYRLSTNYPISKFVYEVPFSTSGDIASEVLYNMEQNLKQYEKFIVGLTKERMYPILPSVWRKGFLKDKRHDGNRRERSKLKEAARLECSIRYPEYESYFYKTDYVPDSTDAIGIFHGFLMEYWYDRESGIKRVSKVNSRYNRNHMYEADIVVGKPDVIMNIAKNTCKGRDIELFAYNKDYSYTDNCEIVTSQTNSVCVLIASDRTSFDLLKWASDKSVSSSVETYAVITYRKRRIM